MLRRILCASAMLLCSTSISAAAPIELNLTADLTKAQGAGLWSGDQAITPVPSLDIAEGDTLDITLDFLGDQQLLVEHPTYLSYFLLSGGPSSMATVTGTVSFLDADGNVVWTSGSVSQSVGSVAFGAQIDSSLFAGAPSPMAFSSVHYVATLDDYELPGLTSRNYLNVIFWLTAEKITVAGGVPEPASWAMMICGFAGVGAAMRRRTAVAVA